MNLSKYFTLAELTRSEAAVRKSLDNNPSEDVIHNLQRLVEKVLDPLREGIGKPITVLSGYRSEAVNKAIGGAKTSQHVTGNACDIEVQGMPNEDLFAAIMKLNLPFDQCIKEFLPNGWIHVSYRTDGKPQRGEKLQATKVNGKTVYQHIIA